MNKAYQRATHKMVDGALTMQQIDKQRELDRFWARQQKRTANNSKAQTASDCMTTATALNADIGLSHGEANHV